MLQPNFSPFPELKTERLLLREIYENDLNEILFLRSDKEILKYLDKDPATVEQTVEFIKTIREYVKNNESILWGITLPENNKVIGTICFWNITKQHYRAEIGYILHTQFQGKGIMHEAMIAVLDYGFNVMKLHSVEANVNPQNIASAKVLERNNFIREGYFKENYYHNGVFTDSAIYSLLTPLQ